MADEIRLQQQARIKPEAALRNIVSNMEFEGFRVSSETIEGCKQILANGENGKRVADKAVQEVLGRVRK